MTLTGWAGGYAEDVLAPLGDRWAHVQGVVRQAERVAAILPAEEREVLVAAAYLHDLGYAPALIEGFHGLDGARHLRALGHERLAGLAAYHSGPRGEAELRGLTGELAEFTDEASATSMALTYCDMTTGPAGEVITYEERLAGVEERHGAGRFGSGYKDRPKSDESIRALPMAEPVAAAMARRLDGCGLDELVPCGPGGSNGFLVGHGRGCRSELPARVSAGGGAGRHAPGVPQARVRGGGVLRDLNPSPCMPCHPHRFTRPSDASSCTASALRREAAGQGEVVRGEAV
jgi:hypothetical protein